MHVVTLHASLLGNGLSYCRIAPGAHTLCQSTMRFPMAHFLFNSDALLKLFPHPLFPLKAVAHRKGTSCKLCRQLQLPRHGNANAVQGILGAIGRSREVGTLKFFADRDSVVSEIPKHIYLDGIIP